VNKTLLFLAFSSILALAGPFEDHLQGRRRPGGEAWTLCVRPDLLGPAELLADETWQRLRNGGGVLLDQLSPAQGADLKATLGADWALVDPKGAVAGKGQGAPRGAQVLEALHAAGGLTRWEAREAFLREHPHQGDALLEELAMEASLFRSRIAALEARGRIRVPAWHPDPGPPPADERIFLAGSGAEEAADEVYRDGARAFRRLTEAPGWHLEASGALARLGRVRLGQASTWRSLFGALAPETRALAAADPEDTGVLLAWMTCLDGADLLPDSLSGLLRAAPGSTWPQPSALSILLEPFRRRRDHEGVRRILDDLEPQAPPEPLTRKGWEDYCDLRSAIQAHHAVNLAAQGAWDQARAAMEASAAWGGSQALRTAFMARNHLDTSGDPGAWRRLLFPREGPRPHRPPMPEAPPPLRLALLGLPPWLVGWTALRDAPELEPWSPGELRWEIPGPRVHAQVRARQGWDARPRWALFRGDELLASGDTLPGPGALASVLAAHGTPLLERYARRLAEDPGHLPTRRARFQAVLARMPDKGVEALAAEDAARALLELPFGPGAAWKPDPDLWGQGAQAVLPLLEERLRTWPSRPGLWKAWISWARFHPGRPSILDLAQSLPFWSPGADWRAGLPYAVQREVAADMRARGDFLRMRDWFQAAWDRLDRRPLKDLRPWERQWAQERRAEEDTAVFRPLRDALRALGLHAEQLELERAFGAMMGRENSRSR